MICPDVLHWYCTCTAHVLQEEDTSSADPTKFVAKKSKAAAKKGVGNTQVRRRRRWDSLHFQCRRGRWWRGLPACCASLATAQSLC